ncbi:MAG: DUF4329 domain-containing protein [Planktomarina sp.]
MTRFNKAFLISSACALLFTAHTAAAQSQAEVRFVKSVLAQLNHVSFKNNREYCGYIGYTPDGTLTATPAKKGRVDSCLANEPPEDMTIIASYHTHGAFSPDAYAEFPSSTDMEGDEEEGIDGYVSTPGGRLWYIDSVDMIASQLCSIGCLPQDPAFQAGLDGHIEQSYHYEDLLDLEAQ